MLNSRTLLRGNSAPSKNNYEVHENADSEGRDDQEATQTRLSQIVASVRTALAVENFEASRSTRQQSTTEWAANPGSGSNDASGSAAGSASGSSSGSTSGSVSSPTTGNGSALNSGSSDERALVVMAVMVADMVMTEMDTIRIQTGNLPHRGLSHQKRGSHRLVGIQLRVNIGNGNRGSKSKSYQWTMDNEEVGAMGEDRMMGRSKAQYMTDLYLFHDRFVLYLRRLGPSGPIQRINWKSTDSSDFVEIHLSYRRIKSCGGCSRRTNLRMETPTTLGGRIGP